MCGTVSSFRMKQLSHLVGLCVVFYCMILACKDVQRGSSKYKMYTFLCNHP